MSNDEHKKIQTAYNTLIDIGESGDYEQDNLLDEVWLNLEKLLALEVNENE